MEAIAVHNTQEAEITVADWHCQTHLSPHICFEQYMLTEVVCSGLTHQPLSAGCDDSCHPDSGSESDDPIQNLGSERCVPSGRARAWGILRGMVLVLEHYPAPTRVVKSFTTQVLEYLTHEDESIFFKRAKYLSCYFMAKYCRAGDPGKPDLFFSPRGHWKLWQRSRMHVNRKNTWLWYSLLRSKTAALPLTQRMVLAAYDDHRVAMAKPDPIDDITHDSIMEGLFPVLEPIRKGLVKWLARNGGHLAEEHDEVGLCRETLHAASKNACWENTRSDGGQNGFLMNPANGGYGWQGGSDLVHHVECDCTFEEKFGGFCRHDKMEVQYIWSVPNGFDGKTFGPKTLERRYCPEGQAIWERNIFSGMNWERQRLRAKVAAVLEPLKVRIISKGEAAHYYLTRRIQKGLHSVMRDMSPFRLIGRTMSPCDLFDLAKHSVPGDDQRWFSIDYKSSTDGLSARLSASIMDHLVQDLPRIWQQAAKAVLAPHHVFYPPVEVDGQVVTKAPVQQQNGQLMGSTLSFPILCIANLGVYLEVLRDDSRELKDKLKGVLVNGDDMGYRAPFHLWERHCNISAAVGLEMSQGKAYVHKRIMNINSACFHYSPELVGDTPYRVTHLNAGLFFGQGKVLAKASDEGTDTRCLSVVISEILRGTLPGRGGDILSKYLTRHRKELAEETRGRNLFIPVSLGGLGQEYPEGWDVGITEDQRRLAFLKYKQSGCAWMFGNPLPGPPLKEVTSEVFYPWMVGKEVTEERRVRRLGSLSPSRCLVPIGLSAVSHVDYKTGKYQHTVLMQRQDAFVKKAGGRRVRLLLGRCNLDHIGLEQLSFSNTDGVLTC